MIVGLPVSLRGGDSDQTRAARAFAERLQAVVPVPVQLYDERFNLAGAPGGRIGLAGLPSRGGASRRVVDDRRKSAR